MIMNWPSMYDHATTGRPLPVHTHGEKNVTEEVVVHSFLYTSI